MPCFAPLWKRGQPSGASATLETARTQPPPPPEEPCHVRGSQTVLAGVAPQLGNCPIYLGSHLRFTTYSLPGVSLAHEIVRRVAPASVLKVMFLGGA